MVKVEARERHLYTPSDGRKVHPNEARLRHLKMCDRGFVDCGSVRLEILIIGIRLGPEIRLKAVANLWPGQSHHTTPPEDGSLS